MSSTRTAHPWVVMSIACMAQYCLPFMLTAVAIILPSVGRDLSASALQLGMVEQSYVVAMSLFMLFYGRLGDITGWRRIYIVGLPAFTVFTGLLGFVPDMQTFIALRILQGTAAASISAGSIALVSMIYPPRVRGRMIGIVLAFTYAGLSTGPVLGGLVVSSLGWRWLFWLFIPMGALVSLLCLLYLHVDKPPRQGQTIDWRGTAVYALSIVGLAAGGSHIDAGPWGVSALVAGLAGLVFFVRLERRTAQPLLDVTEFLNNRVFALSCLAAMGNYASTFGLTFFMSLYLQVAAGLSPHHAGMVLLVSPCIQMLLTPLGGRMADRFSPIRMSTLGMLVTFAGLASITMTTTEHTPVPLIVAELLVMGLGYAIFSAPNSLVIMNSVDRRRYGLASGMIGTTRTLGMLVSMTTITMVISLGMGSRPVTPESLPDFLTCMHVGMACFAVFSLLGIMSLVQAQGHRGRSRRGLRGPPTQGPSRDRAAPARPGSRAVAWPNSSWAASRSPASRAFTAREKSTAASRPPVEASGERVRRRAPAMRPARSRSRAMKLPAWPMTASARTTSEVSTDTTRASMRTVSPMTMKDPKAMCRAPSRRPASTAVAWSTAPDWPRAISSRTSRMRARSTTRTPAPPDTRSEMSMAIRPCSRGA